MDVQEDIMTEIKRAKKMIESGQKNQVAEGFGILQSAHARANSFLEPQDPRAEKQKPPTAQTTTRSKKKAKDSSDIYFPVPHEFSPIRSERPAINHVVIRRIVQGAVKAAYRLKQPQEYSYGEKTKLKALATGDQVETVMHLIESLQPADAIEVALAAQFAIAYLRGVDSSVEYAVQVDLFQFTHSTLEALQRYRAKGAQQISVQYNVNQGQVFNMKQDKAERPPITIDGAMS